MEYNPSLTPAYLAGKVDEYVKFQARDTIKRNARRDRNCRYARIPDGGACDFCKMLGSRGFVYHSEESAGSIAHGSKYDTYHPYCNCQIAVCFDPFMEEYYAGWTKVRRGYGDGSEFVTVTGRDKSDVLRKVDIDELFEEYKRMTKDLNASGKSSKYKDYTKGAKLSDEAFEDAMRRLNEARTLDELHEVGKDIVDKWPKNDNGRDKRQWDELSRRAQELERQFKSIEKSTVSRGRPKYKDPEWNNQEISDLKSQDEVLDYIRKKHSVNVIVDESEGELDIDMLKSVAAGLDDARRLFGVGAVGNVRFDSTIPDLGQYDSRSGTVVINPKNTGPFLTALHEYLHSVDDLKSLDFPQKIGGKTYNTYSDLAIDRACETLGIERDGNRYKNFVAFVYGTDARLKRQLSKPAELAAYSAEAYRVSKGNELTTEIAKQMRNE